MYPAKKACLNCGASVIETYCSTCGQRYEVERFTVPPISPKTLRAIVDWKEEASQPLSTSPWRLVAWFGPTGSGLRNPT